MKVLVLSMLIGILIGTFCVLSNNFVKIFPHIRIVEVERPQMQVSVEEYWIEDFLANAKRKNVHFDVDMGRRSIRIICEVWGEKCRMATDLSFCESGLDPERVGDQGLVYQFEGKTLGNSHGLFQVRLLPGRPEPELLKDPYFNANYALDMFESQGMTPWVICSRKLGL